MSMGSDLFVQEVASKTSRKKALVWNWDLKKISFNRLVFVNLIIDRHAVYVYVKLRLHQIRFVDTFSIYLQKAYSSVQMATIEDWNNGGLGGLHW
jgi:hypothetical protein